MTCNLGEECFRTSWILNEEPEVAELVVDTESMTLVPEVDPRLNHRRNIRSGQRALSPREGEMREVIAVEELLRYACRRCRWLDNHHP